MSTGIIGCGNMGAGMARRLLAEHHPVVCFDPDVQKLKALHAAGCQTASSAAELASDVNILILSLPTADIVSRVMSDIHNALHAGSIVIDTSTSTPATSRKLSKQAINSGFHFLDAPVSGGPAAAINGTMTMLIGGDMKALERAHPVLDLLTSLIVPVGASGAGHAAKIANNMLCAANLVLVSEAIRLAASVGVCAEDLLKGINAGSGRSAVSEVNFPRWILNDSFDSGFTMGLMRKDVRLASELAKSGKVDLAGFENIARLWEESRNTIDDSEDFNRISQYTENH